MSRTLFTEAKLEGYSGPMDISTSQLQDCLDSMGPKSGETMDKIGRGIADYIEPFHPVTSDGYCWFWGGRFKTKSGAIAVLIPWSQDWKRNNGSQADRSMAVYSQGAVTKEEVAEELEHFYYSCLSLHPK
ncbi:MAG: hypothetical protein WAV73_04865 [Candidatus Moraniibacteriota bacterium]